MDGCAAALASACTGREYLTHIPLASKKKVPQGRACEQRQPQPRDQLRLTKNGRHVSVCFRQILASPLAAFPSFFFFCPSSLWSLFWRTMAEHSEPLHTSPTCSGKDNNTDRWHDSFYMGLHQKFVRCPCAALRFPSPETHGNGSVFFFLQSSEKMFLVPVHLNRRGLESST